MSLKEILMWIGCLSILMVVACQGTIEESDVSSEGTSPLLPSMYKRPAPTSIRLVEAGPQGITLHANAGSIHIGALPTHGRLFSTMDSPGCGWTNELGKPRLPAIRRFVEVPAGTCAVQVEAPERSTVLLDQLGADHLIFPVQRPVEKVPGARERTPFEMDEDLYATDAFYPEQSASVSGPFVIRGHRLFLVEYLPFRYNPYRASIQTTPTATLRLALQGGPTVPGEEATLKRFSPTFDAWLGTNVLNYHPSLAGKQRATDGKPSSEAWRSQAKEDRDISTDKYAEGILFVVGNAYTSNTELLNYIDARRAEGHLVTMVPMSDIGATDTALRAYVRGEYLSWTDPALSHVVLVGDVNDVPVHDGVAGDGWSGQVTDLYYASIDPDNYTADLLAPDLLVSRISVNNQTELNTYFERAGKYIYADFPVDEGWMTKFSFLASCDNAGITEGTHNYVINNYTEPGGYTGTHPNDPQPGGDKLYCGQGDASESDIQTALDDGRLVINFSGHGSETDWADPKFTQAYLNGIQPPDAAPFVISNACLTGSFGYSGDCWGEMWLGHSHGAIIFWGASNNSYWDEDDILEKRMWDGVYEDGITLFGGIIRNALLETLAHYGANDDMEYYFEMYNVLGDHTIDFYTWAPFDGMALYPSAIPIGIDQIDFSVTNAADAVQDALVCVRGGVVQQVGTTDASGQVTLLLNPPPDTVGDLQVTITAHNMRRHEGVIQVISASGPYLVHSGHEITSDGTTPVAPTPGRHVVMPITVRNVGIEAALGGTGTLSSDSIAITITGNQTTFPDVAPDGQGRSTTHAEFDIHPDAVDGTLANFTLDWSAQGGAAGTTRFGVAIGRPQLVYLAHTVDDATGNCDQDDIADNGEPTQFQVTIENLGSADASQVAVGLSAPDCDISGTTSIGNIPSGQQGTATFTVVPRPEIACPAENVSFTVSAGAAELPAPDLSSFVELLNADIAMGSFSDDMEGVEPNGWSHATQIGIDDWGYVTTDSHSATHSWFSADVGSTKDALLMTPTITIGDTAQLTFWQRYGFESGYDGGVLEISTNGGSSFSDLGAYITQNGYNDNLSNWGSNPLGGRDAWSGTMAWHQVSVDLSSFGPADVILRFRLGCDSSVGATGWWIDDVQLDAETIVCQAVNCGAPNEPPVADAGADQTVTEDDTVTLDGSGSYDPENYTITYLWSQTAGDAANLSDPHAMNPTFAPPDVAAPTVLTFQLVVSDWQLDSAPDSVDITVNPVNHPPVADAGPDQAVDSGDTVTLDGSSSYDPDGDPIDLSWSQTAGPSVGLSDPLASNPTFLAPDVEGLVDLVFNLVASDGTLAGNDGVTVSVWGGCDDGLTCTDDTFNGTNCEHNPADGLACDDGDACTQADACQAGACMGTDPVVCEPLDQCHVAGNCDPATGVCDDPPAADDTACDDGDACTRTDACQAGTCAGGDAVVCQPLDSCHLAGTCDPATGVCDDPVAEDGAACDDGDGCTRTDTCAAGTCVGSDPVVCEALDACHLAGTCDPATGACSNPPIEDGTACDDGDACTRSDACEDGACVGSDPVVCEALDECHAAGYCDPVTGICTDPWAQNETECTGGVCKDGACVKGSGCGCSHGANPISNTLLGLVLLALFASRSRRGRTRRPSPAVAGYGPRRQAVAREGR